jgi:hypothetical protein
VSARIWPRQEQQQEATRTPRRYWRVRPVVGIIACALIAVLAAALVTALCSYSTIAWLLP